MRVATVVYMRVATVVYMRVTSLRVTSSWVTSPCGIYHPGSREYRTVFIPGLTLSAPGSPAAHRWSDVTVNVSSLLRCEGRRGPWALFFCSTLGGSSFDILEVKVLFSSDSSDPSCFPSLLRSGTERSDGRRATPLNPGLFDTRCSGKMSRTAGSLFSAGREESAVLTRKCSFNQKVQFFNPVLSLF